MDAEEKARKRKLVDALSSRKYGPMTLRALCVIALDVRKLNSMTDAELLRTPGLGVKSLKAVRQHIADYLHNDFGEE